MSPRFLTFNLKKKVRDDYYDQTQLHRQQTPYSLIAVNLIGPLSEINKTSHRNNKIHVKRSARMKKLCWSIWLLSSLFSDALMVTAYPVIQAVTFSQQSIDLRGKLEISLDLTNVDYINPYDYDEIQVQATFTSPSGNEIRDIDGFYMEEYELDSSGNGQHKTTGSSGFKIRLAPDEIGVWSVVVYVKDKNGLAVSSEHKFECISSGNDVSKGFVRTYGGNYLKFDDGTQYIPIGENMCWTTGDVYSSYSDWLTDLSANGGNYIRLWHADWGLGIEWAENSGKVGFEGLQRYNQLTSAYQDWLYDLCEEKGVYVMLTLQHHGQVSTTVDAEWSDNPYNTDNGGPCDDPWDFFSDDTAKALTKNRIRYIIARWGYSTNIMAWELFNEVEWADGFASHETDVTTWHAEMSEYIKFIDPYDHLVTTSYADSSNGATTWELPYIDFTQTHFYVDSSTIQDVLSTGTTSQLAQYGKPSLNGEFGLSVSDDSLASTDPDGIHVHNGLWGGLFGGGLGTAMSWWWDTYFDPQDLYYHFQGISKVASMIPFASENMEPATASISSVSEMSEVYKATLGWGEMGDATVTVSNADEKVSSTTSVPSPNLCKYLYGSQWNTEYRSPPVFTMDTSTETTFTVTTGSSIGASPRIKITLNGSRVLKTAAKTSTSYTVTIPSGQHDIAVDNVGTDWMEIVSYEISSSSGDGTFYQKYQTTLDWGQLGDTSIQVVSSTSSSSSSLSAPKLSKYLYGNGWNTQYRSPPTFVMDTSIETTFTVQTGASTGTSPRVKISLDGSRVLRTAAKTSSSYSVTVPAGQHEIAVDNVGTDWIEIESYDINSSGGNNGGSNSASVDSFVLLSSNTQVAAGWLVNTDYTTTTTSSTTSVDNLSVTLASSVQNGSYTVTWLDCMTGGSLLVQDIQVQSNTLTLQVPSFVWDIAFVVTTTITL